MKLKTRCWKGKKKKKKKDGGGSSLIWRQPPAFSAVCTCLCVQYVWFNVHRGGDVMCEGVQERERHFNSATPSSPVTDQQKKKKKKSKLLNGTLSDTLYISIILWLKLRWHYRPAFQMQKTRISDLISQRGPPPPPFFFSFFLNPFASLHQKAVKKQHKRLEKKPLPVSLFFFWTGAIFVIAWFMLT